MHVWIDIENPPQVQYLSPFKECLEGLGHSVVVTARDTSITTKLLTDRGITPLVIGSHSGSGRAKKITKILVRTVNLNRAMRGVDRPDFLIASGRASALSAWLLRIPAFQFNDYEFADLRTMRLTRGYVVHPSVIDASAYLSVGLRQDQLISFPGLKESISFNGVDVDAVVPYPLPVSRNLVRVLFRPPGEDTHYFVEESKSLALQLLDWLSRRTDAVVVYSPRSPDQERYLERLDWFNDPIVLREGVPFISLLKAVDAVISSGGTMVREAAYLGIPAYGILRSRIGQVDSYLASIGRLTLIDSRESFDRIVLRRSSQIVLPQPEGVVERIARRMITVAQGSGPS